MQVSEVQQTAIAAEVAANCGWHERYFDEGAGFCFRPVTATSTRVQQVVRDTLRVVEWSPTLRSLLAQE